MSDKMVVQTHVKSNVIQELFHNIQVIYFEVLRSIRSPFWVIRDRPTEFFQKIFFLPTGILGSLKPVEYDGENRFS